MVTAAPAEPPAAPAGEGDAFLRDYAETRGFMLGRPVSATPTPDGTAVLFLRARSAREPSQELYEFNVATKETRRLLSPDEALNGATENLSPEEKARRERQRISVGGFTAFSISKNSALVLLSLSGKLYVLDRAKRVARELATGPGTIVDPKFSPDSRRVAYVRNQDVCVFDLAAGREHAVTTGGTEAVSHGLAEFVAQEEMNRFSGFWWSPDSQRIAYQESDASQVESWYVADPAKPGGEPARTFYPRPGKNNVSVRLGVTFVDVPGETVWLDWDRNKYPYLGKVTGTEYGPLTLPVLSRAPPDLALLQADPTWGDTKVLLTEHDDAWVNLDTHMPYWLPSSDGGGFLWTSEREGHWQLERHIPGGALDLIVVPPTAPYRGFAGFADGRVYYLSGMEPMAHRLWRVEANGDDPTEWEHEGDAHTATLGEDNLAVLVDQAQGKPTMPRTLVRALPNGEVIAELPSIALEPPFRVRAPLTEVADDPSYFTTVVFPHNVDHTAHHAYPVIIDVYGGPSHQQVVAAMRPYLLDQWIADQGFIVVAIDGRGTPGRGRDWERAVAGHFGSVPLDDQVAALQALGARHPEMDMERVGITGWSFGGYMAALAVLRRPDVFKAAVAGAPVVDWMDYDTCYTERYLGVPGAGRWPDAYQEGSLLTYAADLRRPLLLIHGTADDNVYPRHSLRLIDALFRAGKPVDFLPLNSFTHMVPDPVVRSRLEERIVAYFRDHLAHPQD